MFFETDFMKLYEELSEINSKTDLDNIVNTVAAEVEKYDENGSNQNCLFSTWAVELQLRGENFLPRPVYSPRDSIFDIKGEELVVEPEVLKISSKEDVETQVLDAGDGARFYCHVNWADSKGGHEFLLVNKNGTVLVVDGQARYIKEINKDKKYFDDLNFENSYIVRFDNKEINQDILKYNDEDQLVEWDDELDPKLLEEGLSQIDYIPVSDVELFKEYADDILDGYGNMSDADIKSSIKEIKFEGRLAGYIGFSEYEENGSKCLGIGNFMIIERGKGLGSAVIQNIVEKYKNQYDLIYCFVDAKNEGAIRLYKKLGKVYDEDGPNDNGEYYVTFWDNGYWQLDN